MRTKQLNIQDRVPCASILIAITIIILFSCSQKAFAQQWSTSGNDISNSNSGNVGVGTTSPGVKLDILSSVSLIARFGSTAAAHSQVLIDAPAGFNSNLTLQRGGVSKWYMGNRAANDRLSFIESTGAIETLTLLQDGKVGVGTTNPGQQLSVVVNDAANNAITHVLSIGHTTSSTPVAGLGSGLTFRSKRTSDGGMGYTGYIAGVWENPTTEDGALVFATALNSAGFGTERMRITSSGNVGIGTSSPGVGGMPFSLNLTLASPAGKRPVFEFVSNLPDGVGYEAGLLDFIFNTNSAGHKRIGMISYEAEGGTANQRGGLMRLFTKANAGGLFERMRIDSSGNVGIGTVNPVFRLDVNGEINATGLRINGTPISTGPSGAVISVFGRTGEVVQQAGDYTWAQITKTTSSLGDLQTRSAADLNAGTVPIARLGVSGTPDATTFLRGDNTWAPVPGGPSQWATTSGTNNISYNAGNVGIGTTTPAAKLDVVGGTYNTGIRITSSSVIGSGLTIKSTDTGGHEFSILATATSITGGAGGLHIYDATANAARMRIGPNGDVGIGTLAPLYKLDVNGEINATGLRINGTPISTGGPSGPVTWAQVDKSVSSLADITTRNAGDLNAGTVPISRIGLSGNAGVSTFLRGDNTWGPVPSSQWTTAGSNIYYTNGRVGIGSANPSAPLSVAGIGTDGTAVFQGSLHASHFNYNGDGSEDTYIRGGKSSSRVIINDQSPANVLLSPNGGNVGIGTTNPSANLEVVGNVNVTGTGNITAAGTIEGGNIKAKYQDVAEWVESSQELPAGTVVVVDHTKSNQVIASSQAYDTRVAGVVSAQPGIALGEQADNKVLVATTGRVRIKVIASEPIQVGDLLVTSNIPGAAMKSQPLDIGGVQIHRPGTLIGKALEPLAKGTGEIRVLLSLQ